MTDIRVDTGSYATHRGRIGPDDYEFIGDCVKRRVPSADIARMINRPVEEVRRVACQIEAMAVVSGELPARDGTVVLLSLFRGLVTRRLRASEILADVAAQWGVSVAELVGPGRTKHITRPRFEAMFRLRETGRYSLPQIAQIFSRDHTTVMSGIRRHKQLSAEADA